MKRQKYYETVQYRSEEGTDLFLDPRRAEIIQMPSGYRYAIRYVSERKLWASVDLLTGLFIRFGKKNPEVQLWMVLNEDRVTKVIDDLFADGHEKLPSRNAHDLIVAELSKDDGDEIAPDLKAYIISKGFRT